MLEHIDKAVGNFINILSGAMPEVSKTAKDLVENAVNYYGQINCINYFLNPISCLLILIFAIIFAIISKKMSDKDNEAFIPVGIVSGVIIVLGTLLFCISVGSLPQTIAACKNPKGALVYDIVNNRNNCNK